MSDAPVKLITAPERYGLERNERLISMLELALEEARAGKWTSALLILENGVQFSGRWMGADDVFRRLGMLEQLKHDWMADE